MSNAIHNLYEKFIIQSGGHIGLVAKNVFAYSSDDSLVLANSFEQMKDIFEIEKAKVFAENKANPQTAKTRTYKFYDNKEGSAPFNADAAVIEKFNLAMSVDVILCGDDANGPTKPGRFVIFTTDEDSMLSFLKGIQEEHFATFGIKQDEKMFSVVPGLKVKLFTRNGELSIKNDGYFTTKQDLDDMPFELSKSIIEKRIDEGKTI